MLILHTKLRKILNKVVLEFFLCCVFVQTPNNLHDNLNLGSKVPLYESTKVFDIWSKPFFCLTFLKRGHNN